MVGLGTGKRRFKKDHLRFLGLNIRGRILDLEHSFLVVTMKVVERVQLISFRVAYLICYFLTTESILKLC